MARKTTDTTDAAVDNATETNIAAIETVGTDEKGKETAEQNKSGFYCYIGPNLKNLIQTGAIYIGTREKALEKAAEAIKAQPLVKTLIVSGDTLGENLQRVKKPGNILFANYQKLAGKEGR